MPPRTSHTLTLPAACVAYCLLILWGSLYPFSGWQFRGDDLALFTAWEVRRLSLPDLIVNALVYIPLGAGLRLLTRHWPRARSGLTAVLLPAALSFAIEAAQAHLPARVPAWSDFVLNTAGAIAGALMATLLTSRVHVLAGLHAQRRRVFVAGRDADLALAALGAWTLAQLTPFVPSLDVGSLRHGAAPLAATLRDLESFDALRAWCAGLEMFGLALLVRGALQQGAAFARRLGMFAALVLVLKVVVVTRQLTLEELLGVALGVTCAGILPRISRPSAALWIIAAEGLAAALGALRPEAGFLRDFNWLPFVAHMTQPMLGLAVLLDTIWPYLVIGAAVCAAMRWSLTSALANVLGCAGFAFGLEWLQQDVVGRTPDITPALIAAAVALAVVWYTRPAASASAPARDP